MTKGRWGRSFVVGVITMMMVGCAGLPSTSVPKDIRKIADESAQQFPRGPEAGQQPEQIVREFIHASALTDYDPAGQSLMVAREFLTPEALADWKADSASTPVVVLADDFSVTPDAVDPNSVTVVGTQIGLLRSDRSYEPVDSEPVTANLRLEQVSGDWRLANPPSELLMTQSDFDVAFRQRTIYFLDGSGRVVVPDIRYIPGTSSPDLAAGRLMDLLMGGPSESLIGGARTQLGSAAQLESNVHIDTDGVAHVDLTGIDISSSSVRAALAAQIVWTLDPDVQQVAITVDGLPLSVGGEPGGAVDNSAAPLTFGAVANFNPEAIPGSAQAVSDAFYISDGAILRLTDGVPLWGSIGTGSVRVLSAAMSAASGAVAAVARDDDHGAQLLVGRPFEFEPMVTVLKADSLSTPSFTRWGYAVWTVQNGATNPQIYEVSISSGAPAWSRILAPGLDQLGEVTALALSPDGVRVAVVADTALYLGVISPSPENDETESEGDDDTGDQRSLQLTGLHLLRADLTDVGPIAWSDSLTLLAGAHMADSVHRTVFEVSVDGLNVEPVTTRRVFGDVFGDVDTIAASGSGLPMLISFGGRIWQLQGTRANGQWVSPDGGNWMQGSSPLYPQ